MKPNLGSLNMNICKKGSSARVGEDLLISGENVSS